MTTGAKGGAYEELGKQYRDVLAEEGITVESRPSEGDIENLARLRDPGSGVDFGLLQGGVTSSTESPGLSSLGTVMVQPVWPLTVATARPPRA